MKKFADLPVYFIFVGLILNIVLYLKNKVPFTTLMIRSSIVTILFAAMGYVMAFVLSEAYASASKAGAERNRQAKPQEHSTSTIDIRINSEEDDELFKISHQGENEEFVEINPENFKRFMDHNT